MGTLQENFIKNTIRMGGAPFIASPLAPTPNAPSPNLRPSPSDSKVGRPNFPAGIRPPAPATDLTTQLQGEGGEGIGTGGGYGGTRKVINQYEVEAFGADPVYSSQDFSPKPKTYVVEPIIRGESGLQELPTGINQKLGPTYEWNQVTGSYEPKNLGSIAGQIFGPLNLAITVGDAAFRRKITGIAEQARIGTEGYAVGRLNNRIIGIKPPGNIYNLFGTDLPIDPTIRQSIIDQLLALPADQRAGGYLPPGTGVMPEGADPFNPTYAGQGQYYSGVGPSPEEGGSPGDPGYVDTPITSSVSYTAPDPATDVVGGDAALQSYGLYGGIPAGYSPGGGDGGGSTGSGGGGGSLGGAGTGTGAGERYRASGGPVGFAEGGNTQKDPIQRTGFVEGPPQEYAKGTTVADTENLRVKEGSFVINAPMTEKLQKAGVLPKGNQKRKAAKGGKMMEVALSKGEYVVEPKDVSKFGGYGFLETVNDMGKSEVERRQAMSNGGEAGIDIPPLSRGFAQKPAFRSVPEGFVQQQDIDPGPIPPLTINNINIDDVQKALTLVETRGYEDRNEGYFFTKSGTKTNPSSAFGPLQVTHDTMLAMLEKPDRKKKIKGGSAQLLIEMSRDPEFNQYIIDFEQDLRNRSNIIQHGLIYEGGGYFDPTGKSVKRTPTAEEKQMYKNLGAGTISVERHKKHNPTLSKLYMRYKAEMSDSEKDLVQKHFGNTASIKKYYAAKKELGID